MSNRTYLLSIVQPDGPAPDPAVLGPVMAAVASLNDDIRAAGAWVFSGGLTPPATAKVVRPSRTDVAVTDGPYAEAEEHLGGFWIIAAPDTDAAMVWAARAARATTLPIEVREMAFASA